VNKFFLEYKDYYHLDELKNIFNDSKSLIIFDTNIFLDLYSYPVGTRQSIMNSIDQLQGILWSPHHVFLEYHKNRREVIHKSKKNLDEIQNTLGSFASGNCLNISSISTYKSKYGKFHSELTDSIQKIIDKYTPLYAELQKQLTNDIEPIRSKINTYKKQDTVSLTGDDPVLNFLTSKYSDDNIGEPYSAERLAELFVECDARILKKIPPAFKDNSKSGKFTYRGVEYDSKYGDFIIYKQILDYCSAKKIANVFFISNDVKRDWREPVPHENDKYYGARRELKAEAYLEANIENLILLDLNEYFKVLGIDLSPDVVQDIEALKRFNNEKKKLINHKRTQELKESLEILDKLKDGPIDILNDFIKSSKNQHYIPLIQRHYPELFNKLKQYNLESLKNVPPKMVDSSFAEAVQTAQATHASRIYPSFAEAVKTAQAAHTSGIYPGLAEAVKTAQAAQASGIYPSLAEAVKTAQAAHASGIYPSLAEAVKTAQAAHASGIYPSLAEAVKTAQATLNTHTTNSGDDILQNLTPEEIRKIEEEMIIKNIFPINERDS